MFECVVEDKQIGLLVDLTKLAGRLDAIMIGIGPTHPFDLTPRTPVAWANQPEIGPPMVAEPGKPSPSLTWPGCASALRLRIGIEVMERSIEQASLKQGQRDQGRGQYGRCCPEKGG